jgi:hypothetical protein
MKSFMLVIIRGIKFGHVGRLWTCQNQKHGQQRRSYVCVSGLVINLAWIELENCREQSPSCEPNGRSPSQEILHLIWNPKTHYRVHNTRPWNKLTEISCLFVISPKNYLLHAGLWSWVTSWK